MKDYRYYKVCRRYSKFVLRHYNHGKKVSAQTVRDAHEYILQVYGLEVNRSCKFWGPYTKFELEVMAEMQGDP